MIKAEELNAILDRTVGFVGNCDTKESIMLDYIQVMGTVTSVDVRTEYRAGKLSYDYSVGISYQPQGGSIEEHIVEHVDMFSKGDTVPVT